MFYVAASTCLILFDREVARFWQISDFGMNKASIQEGSRSLRTGFIFVVPMYIERQIRTLSFLKIRSKVYLASIKNIRANDFLSFGEIVVLQEIFDDG
jgi:hypothetical protein